MKAHQRGMLWIARVLIAVVLFWNLQCAVAFLAFPEGYAPGFELEGEPGSVAVRGMGILFVMWNVPYVVALWHPLKHRCSLVEAIVMQALGVVGESWLWATLSPGHDALRLTAWRFTLFDGIGLVLLLITLWAARRLERDPATQTEGS